jgi:excisionase family DNA binding protein
VGDQTRRFGRNRAGPRHFPGCAPALTHPLRAGEPGHRPAGTLEAPTTSNKDRKRLLRTLIADVTLLPEIDPTTARIGLRWHTGSCDELVADRPLPPGPAKRSPSPPVELVRQLGPTTDTQDLADKLNAAGLTTGHGHPFDTASVQWIRHAYHIPAPTPYTDGEISVADAAQRLGCSTGVIYDWITTGKLTARRGAGNRLCIPWTEHVALECRRRITSSGHLNPAARRTKPRTRT